MLQMTLPYDTKSGASRLLKQQEALGGYDPSRYVSERLEPPARDGVNACLLAPSP